MCTARKDTVIPNIGTGKMTGQRQPGNESHNPKIWNCEPVTKQFSWVPWPCCSLPSHAFPVKSFTSQHMSPQTLHFPVLDKSPLWGPGSGAPSGNKGEEIREDNVSPVFNTTLNSQGTDHNHSYCCFPPRVPSSLNWGNWTGQSLKLLHFSLFKSLTHAYTSCFNPSSRIRSSPSFKKGEMYLCDWSMKLFPGWMRFQEHVEDRDWRGYYMSYYMLTWIL